MTRDVVSEIEQLEAKVDELEARLGGEFKPRKRRSKKGLLALLLGAGGAAGYYLKKKRERELDETLWEEPRDL